MALVPATSRVCSHDQCPIGDPLAPNASPRSRKREGGGNPRTYPWLVTPISHGEISELTVASAAWTSLISGGIASVQKSPMASRSVLYAGQTRKGRLRPD